jgi:hypothetical protein
MKPISLLLYVLLSISFCRGEYFLMSSSLWTSTGDFLTPKDDKKMSLIHQKLSKISAYENVKENACPENQSQWGFFRSKETGQVFVEDNFKILPQYWHENWDEAVVDPDTFVEHHVEMKPFVRCLYRCFDLSEMFAEAMQKEYFWLYFFLVESLVSAGFEVNDAVKEMREKVARTYPADFLVNAIENEGARAISQLGTLNARNNHTEDTALLVAAYGNYAKVAEILIENGADKEARGLYGNTALHYAAYVDGAEVAKILIENKVNKEAKNDEGDTPLHIATIANSAKVAQILIKSGADKTAKGKHGNTPLQVAKECIWERPEVEKILVETEADKDDAILNVNVRRNSITPQ